MKRRDKRIQVKRNETRMSAISRNKRVVEEVRQYIRKGEMQRRKANANGVVLQNVAKPRREGDTKRRRDEGKKKTEKKSKTKNREPPTNSFTHLSFSPSE